MDSKFTILLNLLYCWARYGWSLSNERTAGKEENLPYWKRANRELLSYLEYRRNQHLTHCNYFNGAPAENMICFLEVCISRLLPICCVKFKQSVLMVHRLPICYQFVASDLQTTLLKLSINLLHYCLCSLCGPKEYTLYAKPRINC